MKKKLALLITASAVTSLAIAAIALSPKALNKAVKGDPSYTMVLNGDTDVVNTGDGILYQANIKGNKIDFVGYSPSGGALGSIKYTTYGNGAYFGLVYNRSIINGFTSLRVEYGGTQLYYVFTEFLMQDMRLNGANRLDSGVTYNVPAGCGYFLIYTSSSNMSGIDRIEITYSCQGNLDEQMIFNKNSSMGGARSVAKRTTLENDYVELENNPTRYTNNYSTGKHEGHTNNDSWYRWNGKYFANSDQLGTEFTFGMTIMGEYDSFLDDSQYFHYNVWPQFTYGNENDRPWLQTYIGNDNYEPLGKDHALRPTDPYTKESYEGRFFTTYDFVSAGHYNIWDDNAKADLKDNGEVLHFASEQDAQDYIDALGLADPSYLEIYEDGSYQFLDPDTTYIPDPNNNLTMREAYNRTILPFWFLKFHVYLTNENIPVCDIYINNMLIYAEQELFENYDTVNTPSISIYTLPMHLVNYGINIDADPADSYTGCFTYPRLITA